MQYSVKSVTLNLICLIAAFSADAQVYYSDFITSGEVDIYHKVAVRERQPIVPQHIREADLKYSKRIVRCIDLRQKMNKALAWPKSSLSMVLKDALWEGSIRGFKNDSFSMAYNSEEIKLRGGHEEVGFYPTDEDDPTIGIDTVIWVDLEYQSIKKFWVMEQWNFDSRTGVFKPAIIGIVPIMNYQVGNFMSSDQPVCWIPYNDNLRQLLVRTELFNRYNNAARLNMDDFFQMRLFDSYIIYESNVFDSFINAFQEYEEDSVGALLEGERIKNDLFVFEHDLWQF